MDIPKILKFLQHPDTEWSSRKHERIETTFDIKPAVFLKFSEIDLAANYEHNLINALSNAKRALDCQIDILLIGFGFYDEAKQKMWGFPKKVQKIKELGIIAPRVLNKINRARNLMEHEFVRPDRDIVEDFVDIASLFLASTDKYIYDLPGLCEIENDELDDFYIGMELDLKKPILKLTYIPKEGERATKDYTPNDFDFMELLKAYLNIGTNY